MINLILFGPPGSGKGTQAQFIVEAENLTHISTGDVFRKNIRNHTPLGQLARSYMDKGQLVPDTTTIDLLSTELDGSIPSNGFIFDGFPRTIKQASAFDRLLSAKKMKLSMVISLEVGENELVKRLLKRGIDSGRKDDKDESVIRNRIQVYENQTSILKDHYSQTLGNSFFSINGESSIDKISINIKKIISNFT